MIPIPRDFLEFIQLLNEQSVKYLVVGGYAVAYHGFPRYTGDIDFFVESSLENAERLVDVFQAFGFSGDSLTAQDFLENGNIIRIGSEPMRLEVINEIDGVSFATCFKSRVEAQIESTRVNFIDLYHLRKNKKASARPKDLEDLRRLPSRQHKKSR